MTFADGSPLTALMRSTQLPSRVPIDSAASPLRRLGRWDLVRSATHGGVGQRNERAQLICPWWPTTAGGCGWESGREMIWNEELAAAGMPRVSRGVGEHLVGPATSCTAPPSNSNVSSHRSLTGPTRLSRAFPSRTLAWTSPACEPWA